MLNTMKRYSGRIGLLALLAIVPAAGGCYGRFPLTKAVYKFNGSVSDNEVIVQVVFWVFAWLPVYGFAALGDAIIFNLIEFWTGSTLDIAKTATMPDGSVVSLAPVGDGKTATLTITRDGKVVESRTFVRVNDTTTEMRDANGHRTGTVEKSTSGSLTLSDAAGFEVQTISATQVAAATAK